MIRASEESKRWGHQSLKKINDRCRELKVIHNSSTGKLRLMFEDEAGFGRINKPKYCWCFAGVRPNVPCHHIREYRYVYGAVEPGSGESFFYVMPYCNTDCMNLYLDPILICVIHLGVVVGVVEIESYDILRMFKTIKNLWDYKEEDGPKIKKQTAPPKSKAGKRNITLTQAMHAPLEVQRMETT